MEYDLCIISGSVVKRSFEILYTLFQVHMVLNKEEGRKPHSPRYCHSIDEVPLAMGKELVV